MDFYKRIELEQEEDWEGWIKEIPSLKFKTKWYVQIIPPFRGAIVRFWVSYKKAEVSVYLDCFNRLGSFGSPYWEIYPYDDDVFRCKLHDTKKLLEAIEYSINKQNKK